MIHNPAVDWAGVEFRTSSFTNGESCVELAWRTSSFTDGDNCVELAWTKVEFFVRDSKNEVSPVLVFGERAARSFLAKVKPSP